MSENSSAGPVRRGARERATPYSAADVKVKKEEEGAGVRAVSPPTIPAGAGEPNNLKPGNNAQLISGRYLLLENLEGSNLRRCVDLTSQKEYSCRAIGRQAGAALLEAHFRLEFSEFVAKPVEVITTSSEQFIFYDKNFGDVHALVRDGEVRHEDHAQSVLRQVASAVMDCHSACVVLSDLKMRRFVFANQERNKIVLETLEDATVLGTDDHDLRSYRRIGYPAYLAPEAIACARGGTYAGRHADIWGLGVIFYTVLIGRYPFNDPNPLALFSKILQGHFYLPEGMSTHAKCLIKNLLRKNPLERLSADDILEHPWFSEKEERAGDEVKNDNGDDSSDAAAGDQIVPSFG